jgi:hypothetical protein
MDRELCLPPPFLEDIALFHRRIFKGRLKLPMRLPPIKQLFAPLKKVAVGQSQPSPRKQSAMAFSRKPHPHVRFGGIPP